MAGNKAIDKEKGKGDQITTEQDKSIPPAGWAAISAIGVAIVGCISTIIVSALNPDLTQVILDKFSSATHTPTPTSTAPSSATPSNTPTKVYFTETPTPITLVAAGDDWQSDCISVANWQPDLEESIAEVDNGCYDLIPWGIAANNGNLLLTTVSKQKSTALEYGIFTPLTQNKTFEFSIRVNELTNSEVWIGFFREKSLESQGILITIQNDDNFDVREMPSQKEYADNIHLGAEGGNYENILITFIGPVLYVTVDGQPVIANYPINVSPKQLFLGYRMLPKGEIKATIRDIKITDTETSTILKTSTPTQNSVKKPTETPNQKATLQAAFDEVDQQFQTFLKSNIVYNAPKTMKLDDTVVIELLLNPSLSQEELVTQIVENGVFITSTIEPSISLPSTAESGKLFTEQGYEVNIFPSAIEITDSMRAELKSISPDAFTISNLHIDSIQKISLKNTAKWRWTVTAKDKGKQSLELLIFRLVRSADGEHWHEVEAFRTDIVVQVTPRQWFESLDWKWFIGVLLIPLLKYLYNIRKNKASSSKENDTGTKRKQS
jgi:hypothetical protein